MTRRRHLVRKRKTLKSRNLKRRNTYKKMKKFRGGGWFFQDSEPTTAIKLVKKISPIADKYKDTPPFNDLEESVRIKNLQEYDILLYIIFDTHSRYTGIFKNKELKKNLLIFHKKIKDELNKNYKKKDDEEKKQQELYFGSLTPEEQERITRAKEQQIIMSQYVPSQYVPVKISDEEIVDMMYNTGRGSGEKTPSSKVATKSEIEPKVAAAAAAADRTAAMAAIRYANIEAEPDEVTTRYNDYILSKRRKPGQQGFNMSMADYKTMINFSNPQTNVPSGYDGISEILDA